MRDHAVYKIEPVAPCRSTPPYRIAAERAHTEDRVCSDLHGKTRGDRASVGTYALGVEIVNASVCDADRLRGGCSALKKNPEAISISPLPIRIHTADYSRGVLVIDPFDPAVQISVGATTAIHREVADVDQSRLRSKIWKNMATPLVGAIRWKHPSL